MNFLKDVMSFTTHNGSALLLNSNLILIVYVLIFVILFLENAILPAFFLPGDSLLIFLGILVSQGVLNFFVTLSILTVAVSLGSWVSYLQGRFFKNKNVLKRWLSYLPVKYYQKANDILIKHGLLALFIGRFIAFVRTILPIMVGLSELDSLKFQLCNWLSSFMWVLVLIFIGFSVGSSEYFLFFYNQLFCIY